MASTSVLSITEPALEMIVGARSAEASSAELSLFVEVSGESDGAYSYDMWFEAAADAGPRDRVEHHGELTVVFPAGSAEKLVGATLDVRDDGLVIVNPNAPPRPPEPFDPASMGTLEGPVAQAVLAVLESDVNPRIAAHGGRADLVGVDEEGVAYVALSGGCMGCGMAQVTLSQGIEVAIKEAVPEIVEVVDVTEHARGTNPYYQPAKK